MLERLALSRPPVRIALIGSGGSGKSMLACALGHRIKRHYPGGIHWFRVGAWDAGTLAEMMAIRFRAPRARAHVFPALRKFFASCGPMLIVLDNHEDDRAMARLLNELSFATVTWVITARRCLLGGVSIVPVVAPHGAGDKPAFPRVASLAALLRQNPLALDVSDAIVRSGAARTGALRSWLVEHGVTRVRVIDHEDDLPEVALLVAWAWARLDPEARRILGVLAQSGGDHMDRASLLKLARTRSKSPLETLRRWHLVQEPLTERYALHAVVRHAVWKRAKAIDPRRIFEHYLDLLERHPDRLDLEQTHLYAAMDYAHAQSNLDWTLRIDRLAARLAIP